MKTNKFNFLVKNIFIKHGLINDHAKVCSDAIINADAQQNKVYRDVVFVATYRLRDKFWRLINVKECLPFKFLEISRRELNVSDHEMIVAVVKKSNIFEEIYEILPEPDSLKVDNSFVAQRVSLNFSFFDSTTSYQGEYPFDMANLRKSSFLSFDTPKDSKVGNHKSFLILMNISRYFNSKDQVKIKFFDPNNKNNFKSLLASRNSFSIYQSNEYEDEFNNKETIFFTSDECSFIPIILSINFNNNFLSVEHIHPPTEYFLASEKKELVKFTKNQWLN